MNALPADAPPISSLPAPHVFWGPEHEIDYESLVTEEHKPVDRILFDKLFRLLSRALYASWPGPEDGRSYIVLVDVGWFYQRGTPAVVPDCLLSLGVTWPKDLHRKEGHSYFQWDMGKPADVVIEAVSDKSGGEESFKKNLYAQLGLPYYAVYDPKHFLSRDTLRTYQLNGKKYRAVDPGPWEDIGLGLRFWTGTFEGVEDTWLRWCDSKGEIIPTGEERAAKAEERLARLEESNRSLEEEIRRLKGES